MLKQTRFANVMRYDVRSPEEHQEAYRRDQTSSKVKQALYYLLDTHAELQIRARALMLGDVGGDLAKIIKSFMEKLAEQHKALEALGMGDSEQHEKLCQEIKQTHTDYRAALQKLAGPNFKIAGFSQEIFEVNEGVNIADYHGKFVAELEGIYQRLMELTGQYDADFHRQFFVLADVTRYIAGQLIQARVANSYKQLRSIRDEVQAELASLQYQLREIESPRLSDEDQTGKIPPSVLGVSFARGWLMRELQYVRGSLGMTLHSLKDRLTTEQVQALIESHQWMDRLENRIMGLETHAELQAQFDLLTARQNELSANIFPDLKLPSA